MASRVVLCLLFVLVLKVENVRAQEQSPLNSERAFRIKAKQFAQYYQDFPQFCKERE
jgi:hypothetical protein